MHRTSEVVQNAYWRQTKQFFSEKGYLPCHMWVHMGEKPSSCSQYVRTFVHIFIFKHIWGYTLGENLIEWIYCDGLLLHTEGRNHINVVSTTDLRWCTNITYWGETILLQVLWHRFWKCCNLFGSHDDSHRGYTKPAQPLWQYFLKYNQELETVIAICAQNIYF